MRHLFLVFIISLVLMPVTSHATSAGCVLNSLESLAARVANSSRRADPGDLQNDIWRARESSDLATATRLEEEVSQTLTHGRIVSNEPAGQGIHGARFVSFEDGTRGVWKPFEAQAIAAYQVDRALGQNMVPVTVERTIDGQRGTMQLFVRGEVRDPTSAGSRGSPDELVFFDGLIGNWDRHSQNFFRNDGRMIAIDNGSSFASGFRYVDDGGYRPLREDFRNIFVIRLRRAQTREQMERIMPSPEVLRRLRDTTAAQWREQLSDIVRPEQVNNFLLNRQDILDAINEAATRLSRQ